MDKIRAFSVHAFTSLGSVCAVFSLWAIAESNNKAFFFLMALAFGIDAVDGFFARRWQVTKVLPHFSGDVIDMVIDFANYAVVPAFFLLKSEMLADALKYPTVAFVMLASCYWYGNTDQKTPDHCFKRFPCLWNIVLGYLYLLQASQPVAAFVFWVCIVTSFIPIKFPHGFRLEKVLPKKAYRISFLTLEWTAFIMTLYAGFIFPVYSAMAAFVITLFWVLYVGLGVYRTRATN